MLKSRCKIARLPWNCQAQRALSAHRIAVWGHRKDYTVAVTASLGVLAEACFLLLAHCAPSSRPRNLLVHVQFDMFHSV